MSNSRENNAESTGLHDRFHRSIEYLRISVTDRCNLRCRYCAPAGADRHIDPDRFLSPAAIARFVGVAVKAGLRRVRLTGGEPLLRADILDIVAAVKATGVHDLSLTTNGHRLSAMARALKEAGLDRVNVSLDSLDPARYRDISRGGDLDRVFEGMDAAEAAGLYPLKINMVPMRGVNDGEIARFARLSRDRDIHVRFIECMPVRGAAGDSGGPHPTMDEIMAAVTTVGKLHRLEFRGGGPSRNFRLVGGRGIIGFISPISHHFCGTCNRLRLSADGRLRPCLFSDLTVDVGSLLREDAPDETLLSCLLDAVASKPERHRIREGEAATPSAMSDIGG